MKFENVAEAFNFYRSQTVETIEKRAKEIENEISKNENADVESLSIELDGMKEAKADIEQSLNLLNNAKEKITSVLASADAEGNEGKNTDDDDILATSEYRSAFYKNLQGRQLTAKEQRAMKIARNKFEKRANEFSTSTNSAAVIPTATLDEIVKKARKQGGLMSECRAFAIPSKIAVPIGTPASRAAWHVEGEESKSQKVSPTSVIFDSNEILKIFSISAKVQTMSISAFESYLTDELEACVMETIDDALINGTGSGQGKGLMSITWNDSNSVTTSINITYKDVIAAVALLNRGYANGAKFAMNNKTLWNVFYGMVDVNKRPIFIVDPKIESIGKILGFDVIVDDNIADETIFFGNFAQYLGYNLPNGIVIENSRESSFKSALIDYRALAVADCRPLVEEAFVKLSKSE
ncbi:MAG: phage major capsid protein [Selenomonadaceae bacterium]|nr:phage major capsid protein [Selenomonadaceae bacterium]MBR1730744.1 phage major capsid protein [Selenomonadaceae bacterium]